MRRVFIGLTRIALVALVVVIAAKPAFAQDPLKVAPLMYKVVFENERVRVMEVTFKAGEKIAPHSHPDHFAYILDAGMLKIMHAEGEPAELDGKVGQVVWIPAETHSAQNVGTTGFRALIVELKEPATAAAKAPAAKAAEKPAEKKE